MEGILTFKTTGVSLKVPVKHIVAAVLLVVFLCGLYLSGASQAPEQLAASGIRNTASAGAETLERCFDLPGLYPPERTLDDPGEIGAVVLPWRPPAEDEKENAVPNIAVTKLPLSDVKDDTAHENAAKEEEEGQPIPEGALPISVHVTFHGNGGTLSVSELTLDEYYLDLSSLEKPRRLGKEFDGWYTDPSCTVPFAGIAEGVTSVDIYAGWREFPGFICDDRGYIIGYSDADTVAYDATIILPTSEDCLGVEAGAFDGLEDMVFDLYISPNIIYIAPGVFDSFYNLMYIQVAEGNPSYYSDGGALYKTDGTLYVYPGGWN